MFTRYLYVGVQIQLETGRLPFANLSTMSQVWDWMETSFMESVVPQDEWYNGDPFVGDDVGYSALFNKQCGGFSLVQHRVEEHSSLKYTPSL